MKDAFSLPVVERLVRLSLHHSCEWPDAQPSDVSSVVSEVAHLESIEAMSVAIASRASRRHGPDVVDWRRAAWQQSTLTLFTTFVALERLVTTHV